MAAGITEELNRMKLWIIILIAFAIIAALSILRLLYIQFIIAVWSILMFYLIVRIEGKKQNLASLGLPANEQLDQMNTELRRINEELRSVKDVNRTKELILRKRTIEKRIRETIWKMREDELISLSKLNMGLLPIVEDDKKTDAKKLDAFIEKRLRQIERECEEVIQKEPSSSKSLLLERIRSELKAIYNLSRWNDYNLPSTRNIWITWCIVESARTLEPLDPSILSYATSNYRDRAERLIRKLGVKLESEGKGSEE